MSFCSNFNIYTYQRTTNTNGKLVIDYAEEANLKITNKNFRKRFRKRWTYMSDTNGIKTQVDFILIRNKLKNSVKNSEAYNNFSSIGSEHWIVTATVRMSLISNAKQNKMNIYDSSILQDPKISKEYRKIVKHI